jgi:D-glycero-alpha-D-manno-heptose-7-phosphate kinase
VIISRTPFRVSFFGGGTDYPSWYESEPGGVLVTTIDKYCYISCRRLPPFFPHRHRIVYSKIENTRTVDEIVHPAVRESLRFLKIEEGVEVHHDGDLPARAGLGSSSAFTVGLLSALYALKGQIVGKMQLAREAIHVERDLAREAVGAQDQVATAHGGLNHIEFNGSDITVHPVTLSLQRLQLLESHLMLFFTGLTRNASEVAAQQIHNTSRNTVRLRAMCGMVDEALQILASPGDLCGFGALLDESWRLKRELADEVSNSRIDRMYDTALAAGALGGKLLGAGGGGFLLLFVEPERQPSVEAALDGLLRVPFHFERQGTQIIFYDEASRLPSGY